MTNRTQKRAPRPGRGAGRPRPVQTPAAASKAKTAVVELVREPSIRKTSIRETAGEETWDIFGLVTRWPESRAYVFLTFATLFCLLPFSGRAFHVDDTLFLWAAQQIHQHPLNPYGFSLIWDVTRVPMSSVTQNPPLSSYYGALVGSIFGFSERALHGAFVLVAIAVVLGTYRLAKHFTRSPMFAALAALLTPGVIVSATSIMCDTMMLALWVWAAVFWVEGLGDENVGREKIHYLIASGLLTSAAALSKYFGVALIPLLLAYGLVRRRRAGVYLIPLLIPVAVLLAYQLWTAKLYGHGLLTGAAEFAASQRAATQGSPIALAIVGLSFAGGCSIVGWTFAVFIWPRAKVAIGIAISAVAAFAVMAGWVPMGLQIGGGPVPQFHFLTGLQLLLCVGGGISLLALAASDLWKCRDADSLFLTLWVAGTFLFAAFVNYTVNARSVLPLIPAAGILLARRMDELRQSKRASLDTYAAMILLASVGFSLWIAAGDSSLANSARDAAQQVCEKIPCQKTQGQEIAGKSHKVWFEGHWGLQYYMERLGAEPLDFGSPKIAPGDFLVIPENNIQLQDIQPQYVASRESLVIPQNVWATTISAQLGAGFYSSYWGPLPYAIGPVASERYWIIRLVGLSQTNPSQAEQPQTQQPK